MSGILSIGNFSATGGLNTLGDASVNGRLFVGADASFGGKLFTVGDTSHNARLFVGSDASFGGNLTINGNAKTNSLSVSAISIRVPDNLTSPFSPNGSAAITSSWTVGSITYTASSSKNTSTAYNAFSTSSAQTQNGPYSISSTPGGIYQGSTSTTVGGGVGSVLGEWVQIQSSSPLNLASFSFINGFAFRSAKIWYIVGSNDGTTWNPIFYGNFTSSPPMAGGSTNGQIQSATYTIPSGTVTGGTSGIISYNTYGNGTNSYSYFRIIATTLCNSQFSAYGATGIWGGDTNIDLNWVVNFSRSYSTSSISINSTTNYLEMVGDVSFGSRLFLSNDASLNGNVSIANDLTVNGNMYVKAYTTKQMITELSYQLIIAEDMSVNGRLFLSNDASINGRLFVGGDASFGTRVFIAGDLSVNGNVNVNGNLTAVTQTSTDNSTKVATTAYVKTALGSVGASSYFATDVSMAARLYVISDVSFNGNAYIGKNLILGVSGQYSPFNLDVSGSVNFSGALQGVLTLPDGSHMISNNEALDFSNNFCTTLGPQITVSANTLGAIMMSATGQYQTAPTTTGGIHTSSNFGVTWILNTSAPTTGWGTMGSCVMSANGQYQYALSKGSGYIYFSSDYGATWAQFSTPPIAGAQYYGLIAVSANNRFITVVVGNSSSGTATYMYVSTPSVSNFTIYNSQNYGATWTSTNNASSSNNAFSLAMSANGQYQTITANNYYLYTSKNYGITWTYTNNTAQSLVSMSATGQYIYYTQGNGGPAISNNYGQSFTNCTWSGVTGYTGSDFVLVSSTGQYVIVIYANGYFFTSVNYGQNWKNLGYGYISGAAMSSNGKYVTLIWGGIVYTFTVPNLNNFQTIGKFISAGDASFGSRLFVTSDASFGGKLYVASTLTKGGGSFDIVHPDPAKPIGSRLRHCFVEAPTRGDNIYRYKVTTTDLSASFVLPSYYKFLNEDTQIWVNPANCLGSGYGTLESNNETVQIKVSQDGDYNVLIIGTRKDQMMIDFFDNAGGVEYYVGTNNVDALINIDVSTNTDVSGNEDVSGNTDLSGN